MSKNWYPIINSNCNGCMACVVACPKEALVKEDSQINLKNADLCPTNCNACKIICPENAISYYDGTTESLMKAFSGTCNCH